MEIAPLDDQQAEVPVTTFAGMLNSFPFPTFRTAQSHSIEVAAKAHDLRRRFTIIEAPTGSGKSGIGLTPAIWSATTKKDGGANYLTSQNTLLEQLVNDFGSKGLVHIKGKANYRCVNHVPLDCNLGASMNPGGKSCPDCPYRIAKNAYVAGKLGVTNYAYYLTETMHSGELLDRDYLICDEAHNIEKEVLAMVNIRITSAITADIDTPRPPVFRSDEDNRVRAWLSKVFLPKAYKRNEFYQNEIAEMNEMGTKIPADFQKQASALQQLLGNLRHYMDTSDKSMWLSWTDEDGALLVKPLTAADFAHDFLFRETPNILLMSATILDLQTFRRNLGIEKADSAGYAVASDFAVENRRIVHWPVGSMGTKSIQDTMPRMAERIAAILSSPKYRDVKGIIHTHSYKINDFLVQKLTEMGFGSRLVSHNKMAGSRDQAIADHYKKPGPTMLMSPSMTEGLDLKDDLSRLQIICKVPYPFLDPYNRTRLERDPKWYRLQTATTLVQGTGRSVRSQEDWAVTVILDADFSRFLSESQDILPEWWLNSIEFR